MNRDRFRPFAAPATGWRGWPRHLLRLLAVAVLALAATEPAQAQAQAGIDWVVRDDDAPRVQLYFFWSKTCPHCREALPFVERLAGELPWLAVQSHEITESRDNVSLYVDMARQMGQEARSVPAFFICEQMLTGYDGPLGIGAELRRLAELCRPADVSDGTGATDGASAESGGAAASGPGVAGGGADTTLEVPVLGRIDTTTLSLPVFTLVIAALDAFNPCAFFVLLFLLSLMVHARSRRRMLLVGGTFVLFSGLVYFLFMAAWLSLFLVVGGAPVVTFIAGLVAIVIGGLNVKDFFLFQQGPTLSIPEGAKPGLFRRMRGLVAADNLLAMLAGTVVLALAANSYELLCTAGFPMVYTRVLTLHDLGPGAYYGYLALYNLIYVLPLAAIVLVFTVTLGARRMSERQGRVLKLLSGVMMLGLGLLLLLAPGALGQPWVGAALLALAVVVTALAAWLTRPAQAEQTRRLG